MARRSSFTFKQFHIEQDRCAMKVTSDACLFGAFVDLKGADHILDIGAGTGLLAIMAAQRSQAWIDTIEIDEQAASQAKQNIATCSWSERIRIRSVSIQEFSKKAERKYDIILSNPPFYSKQTKSSNPSKRTAWHDENLSLPDLMSAVSRLLNDKGQFYVLLPLDMRDAFSILCQKYAFYMIAEVHIKHFAESDSRRIIITCSRIKAPVQKDDLIVYDSDNKYSQIACKLLKPFYLNL